MKEAGANYRQVRILSQKNGQLTELIQDDNTGENLVRHIYPDDKREVFLALQQITSLYLPKILDVQFTDGTIVYEQYIDGIPLDLALTAGPVTPKTARRWAKELAIAVEVLHEHNVLHRDIKPENIIVTPARKLVLVDFGIARVYREGAAQDTALLGTSGYAAPEQYGFSQSDYRTDIYAVGVTLKKIIAAAGCGSTSPLVRIATKCAQFDPSRRFQTSKELAAALKHGWLLPAAIAVAGSCLLVIIAAVLLGKDTGFFSPSVSSMNLAQPGTMSPINQSVSIDQSQFTRGTAEILSGDWVTEWQDERIFESYYTNEALFMPSLLLSDGQKKSGEVRLSAGMPSISVAAVLNGEWLTLELSDGGQHTRTISLKNMVDNANAYSGTAIEAEVLVFDMDNDGVCEILPALTDCKHLQLVNGQTTTNNNWRAAWCVTYTPEGGFAVAQGQMYCLIGTMEVGTYVVPEGIWIQQTLEYYVLEDGKIVYYKAQ